MVFSSTWRAQLPGIGLHRRFEPADCTPIPGVAHWVLFLTVCFSRSFLRSHHWRVGETPSRRFRRHSLTANASHAATWLSVGRAHQQIILRNGEGPPLASPSERILSDAASHAIHQTTTTQSQPGLTSHIYVHAFSHVMLADPTNSIDGVGSTSHRKLPAHVEPVVDKVRPLDRR